MPSSVVNFVAAAAADAVLAGLEEVEDPVAGDGVEPAAEGAARGVVVEAGGGRGDAAEHVLHDVGGVGVLQAALAGEAVDDGGVELDELPPGVAVAAVADADEQAGTGQRSVEHEAPGLRGPGEVLLA